MGASGGVEAAAFAHGIESPGQRTAAGKPAEATILLRARSEGNFVVIQVRDDGRGAWFDQAAAGPLDRQHYDSRLSQSMFGQVLARIRDAGAPCVSESPSE